MTSGGDITSTLLQIASLEREVFGGLREDPVASLLACKTCDTLQYKACDIITALENTNEFYYLPYNVQEYIKASVNKVYEHAYGAEQANGRCNKLFGQAGDAVKTALKHLGMSSQLNKGLMDELNSNKNNSEPLKSHNINITQRKEQNESKAQDETKRKIQMNIKVAENAVSAAISLSKKVNKQREMTESRLRDAEALMIQLEAYLKGVLEMYYAHNPSFANTLLEMSKVKVKHQSSTPPQLYTQDSNNVLFDSMLSSLNLNIGDDASAAGGGGSGLGWTSTPSTPFLFVDQANEKRATL